MVRKSYSSQILHLLLFHFAVGQLVSSTKKVLLNLTSPQRTPGRKLLVDLYAKLHWQKKVSFSAAHTQFHLLQCKKNIQFVKSKDSNLVSLTFFVGQFQEIWRPSAGIVPCREQNEAGIVVLPPEVPYSLSLNPFHINVRWIYSTKILMNSIKWFWKI